MPGLNWGKLVTLGRARSHGVSWTEKEACLIAAICKASGREMKDVAEYIRQGVTSVEEYKDALAKEAKGEEVVNPLTKLPKEELVKMAKKLGIEVSPEAPKEAVLRAIEDYNPEEEKAPEKATVRPQEEVKEPVSKATKKKVAKKIKSDKKKK